MTLDSQQFATISNNSQLWFAKIRMIRNNSQQNSLWQVAQLHAQISLILLNI
jgi:hypothetical protein